MSVSLIGDTVAVAESITGGIIADAFVSEKGASKYFKGGITTYSLSSKEEILHISPTLLKITNGVSITVCECMAKEVATLFKADYGIATTGYAEEEEDGNEPKRISRKRYAYVSLYSSRLNEQYTTIVLERIGDNRNGFRYHVAEVAGFLWVNRNEFLSHEQKPRNDSENEFSIDEDLGIMDRLTHTVIKHARKL
jgi:PncC family amidohydrolase